MVAGIIRIAGRFQGPTGSGHGGWTAHKVVAAIGQPATVAIRAPIPIETDLRLLREGDRWLLRDELVEEPVIVMEATRWEPDFPSTAPLSIDEAAAARQRFGAGGAAHPVPYCFSCGLQPDSMQVHAGPVGDGRFATDWRVPGWAVGPDGAVDEGAVWAAIDCTAAWYVGCSTTTKVAFTVQYAAEVLEPLDPEGRYALVGWEGDWNGGWNGRKRGAASAAFAADGSCVARSRSLWVAVA